MKALVAFFLVLGLIAAQDNQKKETQRLFGLAATRAVAYFRSADSVEASLHEDGAVLHPQIVELRLKIEAALDEAQAAIDKSDFDTAKTAIQRAEAWLDRFARRFH